MNGAYFGALLPAHTTEVTLRYRPRGFNTGLAISVVALATVILLAAWRPRRPV